MKHLPEEIIWRNFLVGKTYTYVEWLPVLISEGAANDPNLRVLFLTTRPALLSASKRCVRSNINREPFRR
jgi:hypothetical protein